MVVAPPPDIILEWLDFSLPAMLLGKKANNPTLWRILDNLKKGRQKCLHPATEAKLLRLSREKVPDPAFMDDIERLPNGLAWESTMRSLNLGLLKTGGNPLATLEAEAIRLERLAVPVKEAISRGEFQIARDLLLAADMPPLRCLPGIIDKIDCSASKDHFSSPAEPMVIVTTLYLLACAEADWCDEGEALGEKLLPEIKNRKLIRPMRRWLEGIKEANNVGSHRQLALMFLPGQEPETSWREYRKWMSGEVPAWTRVARMVQGVKVGEGDVAALKTMIGTGLIFVRILDALLVHSAKIRNPLLTYDPWSPFQDYPLMLAHARVVKAGLPTRADSPSTSGQSSS